MMDSDTAIFCEIALNHRGQIRPMLYRNPLSRAVQSYHKKFGGNVDMRVYGFTEMKQGIMEVENSLKAEQAFVGGYIEVYCISDKLDVVCNDEGKINGLELRVAHIEDKRILEVIAGDCFVCRHNDEGEFVSIEDEDLEVIKEKLKPVVFTIGNRVFVRED